jgi:hypothetical protein
MQYLTWLFLLLVVGCASKPQANATSAVDLPDRQQALNNLKSQAEEVGRAAVNEDHARMSELTHPVLVDKFGGRAAFVKKLESIAAEMKGQGFRLKKFTIGEPSQMFQAVGEMYAIVPLEVALSGPRGATGKQPSYLIAVSPDRGASWKFIDGAGFRGDRSKLKELLPSFPEQLQLPAAQPPVWDK